MLAVRVVRQLKARTHLFNQLELYRWEGGGLTGFGFETNFIVCCALHDAPQLWQILFNSLW